MKINLHFKGIEAETHHRDHLIQEAQDTFGKFEHAPSFTVNIYVKKGAVKHKHSKDSYECEVEFRGEKLRGVHFFKKSDGNYYKAINKAFSAAKKSLQKESHIRQSRRHNNLEPAWAA